MTSSYCLLAYIPFTYGRSLFIADAVNQKNYFFNLADDPRGTRNRLSGTKRRENETLIHDLVVSVNRFYGLGEYP